MAEQPVIERFLGMRRDLRVAQVIARAAEDGLTVGCGERREGPGWIVRGDDQHDARGSARRVAFHGVGKARDIGKGQRRQHEWFRMKREDDGAAIRRQHAEVPAI